MAWFVLSPCGTSLLMNGSLPAERALLSRSAHARSPDDLSVDERTVLQQLLQRLREDLEHPMLTPAEAAGLSAELNGIIALYREADRQPTDADEHIVLATDTWLGEETARLVVLWLQRWGVTAAVYRQSDLRTDALDRFQQALVGLVQWVERITAEQREAGRQIVFNLTGGFKSVQGFLQTVGMFYADETVYVFEAPNAPLLRIPRLPAVLTIAVNLREHLPIYRKLALGEPVGEHDELWRIADQLLVGQDGTTCLSAWGDLQWRALAPQLYREQLWPSPSQLIVSTREFAAEVVYETRDNPSLLMSVNQAIDRLAVALRGGRCDPDLLLNSLPDGRPGFTHSLTIVPYHAYGYLNGDIFFLRSFRPDGTA